MLGKLFLAVILAIAITVAPAHNAVAAGGNGFFSKLFGGVKKKKKHARYVAAVRRENKKIQTALNYYDFPAGVADGVMGSKTRNAISSYQIFLGDPVTGHLTGPQKNILLSSHKRSLAGKDVTSKGAQDTLSDTRAMLNQVQQEMHDGLDAPTDAVPKQIIEQPVSAENPVKQSSAKLEPTDLDVKEMAIPEPTDAVLPESALAKILD